MAVKLNLLPLDYTVSDSVAKILKITRSLNIVLLGIFMICAMAMAGFFVYSSITIKNLNSINDSVKNQIQAQQTAQQQIILLKDRLGKIKKVFSKPAATKNLSAINTLLTNLPDTVSVSQLIVDALKINVLINFKTNTDLSNFINSLNNQTIFSNISMESFNYNPDQGYIVEFSFIVMN